MHLTTQQAARFTDIINNFGDALSQDHNDHRMHEWFVVIRKELTDEAPPQGHPELRNFLDFVDRIGDRIDARRRSTGAHIAMNLQAATSHLIH